MGLMEESPSRAAYQWILWGVFCSVFHFEISGLQIFPAWVGYGMAAYGIFCLSRAFRTGIFRRLPFILALLVFASFTGYLLSKTADMHPALPGIFSLVVPALEFAAFLGCLEMMGKEGAPIGAYKSVYRIIVLAGLAAGVCGTVFLWPLALYVMAFALIAGKVVFFFCVWGESRRLEG